MENDPFEVQMEAARTVGKTLIKWAAIAAAALGGVVLISRVVNKYEEDVNPES